jgi:hypothetical protein
MGIITRITRPTWPRRCRGHPDRMTVNKLRQVVMNINKKR